MSSSHGTLSSPPPMPTRVLVLVGYFACVAALVSAMVGSWAVYHRHVVLAHWPGVVAEVQDCRVQRYDALLQTSSSSYAVRCRLAYGIGVVHYVVPVRSRFSMNTADSLTTWVAAHPRGSQLFVHYDPHEPSTVSLAGTGVTSEDEAGNGPFRGALSFGVAGLMLLIGGALIDRRRAAAERAWDPSRFRTPPVSMGAIS